VFGLKGIEGVVTVVLGVDIEDEHGRRRSDADVASGVRASPPSGDGLGVGGGVEDTSTASDGGDLAAEWEHRPTPNPVLDGVGSDVGGVDDGGVEDREGQGLGFEILDYIRIGIHLGFLFCRLLEKPPGLTMGIAARGVSLF